MSLIAYNTYQNDNDEHPPVIATLVADCKQPVSDDEEENNGEELPTTHAKVISFRDNPEYINEPSAPPEQLLEIDINNQYNYNTDFDSTAVNIPPERSRTFSEDSNLTITSTFENGLCVLIVLIVLGCIVYFGYLYSVYEDNKREEYENFHNETLEY